MEADSAEVDRHLSTFLMYTAVLTRPSKMEHHSTNLSVKQSHMFWFSLSSSAFLLPLAPCLLLPTVTEIEK